MGASVSSTLNWGRDTQLTRLSEDLNERVKVQVLTRTTPGSCGGDLNRVTPEVPAVPETSCSEGWAGPAQALSDAECERKSLAPMQIRTSGSYIVSDTIKYFAENERMSQCLREWGVGEG